MDLRKYVSTSMKLKQHHSRLEIRYSNKRRIHREGTTIHVLYGPRTREGKTRGSEATFSLCLSLLEQRAATSEIPVVPTLSTSSFFDILSRRRSPMQHFCRGQTRVREARAGPPIDTAV